MSNTTYSIQIDLVDTEHAGWIQDLCSSFQKYVSFEITAEDSYYKGGCTLILNSKDYPVMKQLAEYICTKVSCITHIEQCVFWSFGCRYWISYCIRSINLVCTEFSAGIKAFFLKLSNKRLEHRKLKCD